MITSVDLNEKKIYFSEWDPFEYNGPLYVIVGGAIGWGTFEEKVKSHYAGKHKVYTVNLEFSVDVEKDIKEAAQDEPDIIVIPSFSTSEYLINQLKETRHTVVAFYMEDDAAAYENELRGMFVPEKEIQHRLPGLEAERKRIIELVEKYDLMHAEFSFKGQRLSDILVFDEPAIKLHEGVVINDGDTIEPIVSYVNQVGVNNIGISAHPDNKVWVHTKEEGAHSVMINLIEHGEYLVFAKPGIFGEQSADEKPVKVYSDNVELEMLRITKQDVLDNALAIKNNENLDKVFGDDTFYVIKLPKR